MRRTRLVATMATWVKQANVSTQRWSAARGTSSDAAAAHSGSAAARAGSQYLGYLTAKDRRTTTERLCGGGINWPRPLETWRNRQLMCISSHSSARSSAAAKRAGVGLLVVTALLAFGTPSITDFAISESLAHRGFPTISVVACNTTPLTRTTFAILRTHAASCAIGV